ncbi:SOS response-associated peptidase [Agromyces humatus]|uniref:Abasic site processing protein n=1 Tax=Agromyces humatus TaxID=279573 RepID=A0ABN2KGI2_9MICO|nr:SOS response-associated peptidase [Agromyces humatus]
MCGRFVISDTTPDLVRIFDVDTVGEGLPEPSWNVRPTDPIPVVLESKKEGPVVRRLEAARWSLVPSFSKELKLKYPTFNARSEGLATSSAYRASLAGKRAIIPADGYYEWHTVGKQKTPYFIHRGDGPIAFAGLYSWWRDKSKADDDPDRWVLTATIITTDATGELADIHDRIPVMLPPEFWSVWLDPDATGDQSLVDQAVAASRPMVPSLAFHEVGPVTDNGPELIEPVQR